MAKIYERTRKTRRKIGGYKMAFEESKHPRDKNGQFTSKGGGASIGSTKPSSSTAKSKPLKYSREYDGLDEFFDVLNPQETADIMGKEIEDDGKIYKPKNKDTDAKNKTLTIPKETLNKALDIYFKDKNYTIEKVPISQLVKDNDLLNDDDLESYHQTTWNNAKAKDLSIDENKLNKMSVGDVPYATKRNGKLIIGDGRHRIRAAWNNGYKFIEIPVINDEDEERKQARKLFNIDF